MSQVIIYKKENVSWLEWGQIQQNEERTNIENVKWIMLKK